MSQRPRKLSFEVKEILLDLGEEQAFLNNQ